MKVSDFQEITFDQTRNALLARVNTNSEFATVELIKEAQYKILDAIEAHQPKNIVINVVDLRFPITLHLQEWLNEYIIPRLFELGVAKIAYIMPKDFIEKISMEQVYDEVTELAQKHELDFGTNFFDQEEHAFQWFRMKKNNLHLIA